MEYTNELYHFGIKGMKWGVRRFQNADGSLKPAGEKRYTTFREASKKARVDGVAARKAASESGQLNGIGAIRRGNKIQREAAKDSMKEIKSQNKQAKENNRSAEQTGEKKGLSDKQKKAIKVGAAVAGTALAAYGAYKLNDYIRSKNRDIRMDQAKKRIDDYIKRGTFNTYRGIETSELMRIHRAENDFMSKTIDRYSDMAKKDSFGTALKNVTQEVYEKHKDVVVTKLNDKKYQKANARTQEAIKAGQRFAEQQAYLLRNINNMN